MREQENIGLVRQAYENFTRGEINALLGQFSDDIEWRQPGVEGAPLYRERHGREQVAEFFAELDAAEEVVTFEPREFIAQGDRVVVLGRYRFSVRETARQYESEWAHVFTVRDGKIATFQEYMDTAALRAAFQQAASA